MIDTSFTLVVEGLDLDDPDQVDALWSPTFQVTPMSSGTLELITVEGGTDCPEKLVHEAVTHIRAAGVTVVRVDLDLVNANTISENADVTRQAVTNWVSGIRGDGRFPTPYTTIGPNRIWDWYSVREWLSENGHPEVRSEPTPLSAVQVAQINATIATHLHHAPTSIHLSGWSTSDDQGSSGQLYRTPWTVRSVGSKAS